MSLRDVVLFGSQFLLTVFMLWLMLGGGSRWLGVPGCDGGGDILCRGPDSQP